MINHPLTKLGTHPLGKIKKIVQKNSPKNGSKNGPKNSPMVQGSNGPVHILPYAMISTLKKTNLRARGDTY